MRVIGLDLGTQCGYAFTHDDKPHLENSGVADFAPKRHEGGGMRFLRFRKFLEGLVGDYWNDPEGIVVFYEEVAAHKGTAAAHIYGGLLGILSEYCEERKVPYRGLPVGTIKKHATGKGNANKNDMMAKAETRWGRMESHDQADALWILSLGLKELKDG